MLLRAFWRNCTVEEEAIYCGSPPPEDKLLFHTPTPTGSPSHPYGQFYTHFNHTCLPPSLGQKLDGVQSTLKAVSGTALTCFWCLLFPGWQAAGVWRVFPAGTTETTEETRGKTSEFDLTALSAEALRPGVQLSQQQIKSVERTGLCRKQYPIVLRTL